MNVFDRQSSRGLLSLSMFCDKNDDIDALIVDICRGLGTDILASVRNCVTLYAHGLSIVPEELLKYVEHLHQYDRGRMYHLNFLDLESMLMHLPCVYKNGENWEKIIHVRLPPHQITQHVPRSLLENLSISTTHGGVVVGGELGINALDYISRKYDGINVKSLCVSTPSADFYVYVYNNKWVVHPQKGYVFSGEMIDNKIILTVGSELLIMFPARVQLENFEYELEPTVPVNVEKFKHERPNEMCDGFILSINGREYKIKWFNTIDFKFKRESPGFVYSSNGTPYKIKNVDYYRLDGIYECEDKVDGVTVGKLRTDKTFPQSDEDFSLIVSSPTVEYVQKLLVNFAPNISYVHRDIMPSEVLAFKFFESFFSNSQVKRILVTRQLFFEYCKKYGYYITGDITSEVRRALFGPGGTWGMCGFDLVYSRVAKYKQSIKYATCSDVYRILGELGMANSLMDLAHLVSKAGYIVSIRRIWLMMCRSEIMMIGSTIFPVVCGGRRQRFTSFIPPRVLSADTTGYLQSMVSYMKNNVRKYAIDDYTSSFHAAAQCLKNFDNDTSYKIGDLLVLFARALLSCYDPGALSDDSSFFWQIVMSCDGLSSYVKRIEKFVDLFECVENHTISQDHICSNGVHFKRNLENMVSSPFVEKLELQVNSK